MAAHEEVTEEPGDRVARRAVANGFALSKSPAKPDLAIALLLSPGDPADVLTAQCGLTNIYEWRSWPASRRSIGLDFITHTAPQRTSQCC